MKTHPNSLRKVVQQVIQPSDWPAKWLCLLMANSYMLVLVAVAGFIAHPATLHAQAQERVIIEEILVTAQKREQSLQEVPVSVTAFTGEDIRRADMFDPTDLAGRTPGLTFPGQSDPTRQSAFIRGIGSTNDDAAQDPSVTVFVDEVLVGRITGLPADLFDMERVEVLRGPQGTLFGKNVVGGAIHFITAKPTAEPEARISARYGNFDLLKFKGAFSGPLSDVLQARVAFSSQDSDGHTKNLFTGNRMDDLNTQSARLHLKYLPSDNLEVLWTGSLSRTRVKGRGRGIDPISGPFTPILQQLEDGDPRTTNVPDDGSTDRDMASTNLNIEWSTSYGTLTSITAYRHISTESFLAFFPPVPPFLFKTDLDIREEADQFTQEIRFSSPVRVGQGSFNWLVGAFYQNLEINREHNFVNTTFSAIGGPDNDAFFDQFNEIESIAGFVNVEYAVTDRFTATGGVRLTHEKKDVGVVATGAPARFLLEDYDIEAKDDWTKVTPKFSLIFQAAEDVNLFATAARGFKSGGFQGRAATAESALRSFDPELAWNFEIGAKTQWFSDRVRLNVVAFYTDYTDLQTEDRDPESQIVFVSNAASAEIKGVEAEVIVRPAPGFDIFGTYAYNSAKFKQFLLDEDDLSGNFLPFAPEHSFSAGMEYSFPLGDIGRLAARGEIQYVGRQFLNVGNSPIMREPGYEILDVRLTYTSPDGRWEVSGWSKNLTDQVYRTGGNELAGFGLVVFNEPRRYGLQLSWQYN